MMHLLKSIILSLIYVFLNVTQLHAESDIIHFENFSLINNSKIENCIKEYRFSGLKRCFMNKNKECVSKNNPKAQAFKSTKNILSLLSDLSRSPSDEYADFLDRLTCEKRRWLFEFLLSHPLDFDINGFDGDIQTNLLMAIFEISHEHMSNTKNAFIFKIRSNSSGVRGGYENSHHFLIIEKPDNTIKIDYLDIDKSFHSEKICCQKNGTDLFNCKNFILQTEASGPEAFFYYYIFTDNGLEKIKSFHSDNDGEESTYESDIYKNIFGSCKKVVRIREGDKKVKKMP